MNFRVFSTLILCLLPTIASAKTLSVVTSIKPLQLIADEIVGDQGKVSALIPPGASPHHYAMKPSDRRKLAAADLVVWVGPQLETFLSRPLDGNDAPVLQLLADGEAEEGHHDDDNGHDDHAGHDDHEAHDEHQGHEEAEVAGHEDHHDHDHGGQDVHIWLDPFLALEVAGKIKQQLSAVAPQQQAQFEQNYNNFARQLLQTDKAIRQQLGPVQDSGFFVFHDAYGHFVDHYHLNQLGYFTVDPGRQPGARHLAKIRQQLENNQAACVFSEPQFKASVVTAITEGIEVGHGVLDPLARDQAIGPGGYLAYLQSLADQLTGCLAR